MIENYVTSRFLQDAPAGGRHSSLEPILHPSPWRIRLLGFALLCGNPLFYWVWSSWLKQPYENLWLRAFMSLLAIVLLLKPVHHNLSSRRVQALVSVIMWIEFPLFFSWMYLCNGGGPVWLASTCATVLIYYHLTDWRIATAGVISGAFLAWLVFRSVNPNGAFISNGEYAIDAVVMGFSWGSALLLGLSSANLRRDQISHTLATMGIMAHELRTPLATAALIGDAMQQEVERHPEHPRAPKLEKLGQRLHTLVRSMNHQIDMQIANAKLLQLQQYTEKVSAGALVQQVVDAYPYASSRQRECVKVVIDENFTFCVSATQFSQVLDNLIKNALHSLAAADSLYQPGALRIEVRREQKQGRILVADAGIGIEAPLLAKIFKPFFSSNKATGHGLGLAFCQRVVHAAGGTLQVKSKYGVGAVFTLALPIAE